MKINKEKLLDALKKCMPGIDLSDKMTVGSDCFYFKNGYVYSLNNICSVVVYLGDDLKELNGSVKADEFHKIISKLSGDIILDVDGTNWNIKCGKAKITIALLEKNMNRFIEEINAEEKIYEDLPITFFNNIKICRIENNNTEKNGIYISEKSITATNGMCISWLDIKNDVHSFWMDENRLSILLKFEGIVSKIYIDNSRIYFSSENNNVFFSFGRLIDSNYPFEKSMNVYNDIIEKENVIEGVLPVQMLLLIDKASSFSTNINSYNAICLKIDSKKIECSSKRNTGSYNETIAWNCETKNKFETMIIYVSPEFFKAGLDISSKICIKQFGKKTCVLFIKDNYTYVMSNYMTEEEEK